MKKKIIAILIILLISFSFNKTTYTKNNNLRWVADIPVMSGFTLESKLSFSFDTPEKRIIVFYAYSSNSEKEVISYYDEIMIELGWHGNLGEYKRGNERLKIKKLKIKDLDIWKITLS